MLEFRDIFSYDFPKQKKSLWITLVYCIQSMKSFNSLFNSIGRFNSRNKLVRVCHLSFNIKYLVAKI